MSLKDLPRIGSSEEKISFLSVAASLLYTAGLFLVFFIMERFNLDYCSNILDLKWVTLAGFTVYVNVPSRYKLPAFSLIFMVCIYTVFTVVPATILFLILLSFFLIIQSQLKWGLKLLIVALMMLFLLAVRANVLFMPRVALVVPFALAIVMFRGILLMYEVKYNPPSANSWFHLGYFFIFPNLAFLFFPIVDNKFFVKSFLNRPYREIYKRGLFYLLFGMFQITVYKVIHDHFLVQHTEHTIWSLLRFTFVNYFMILKITGILTIAFGFLVIFGFNLPPLFGNFFLAPSFTDYWRRANIYWREFVIKIVYYPLYFRLKKKIPQPIFVCVIIAFTFSYIFHSYQLFCINGYYTFRANDLFYWLTLGLIIGINATLEHQRISTSGKKTAPSRTKDFFLRPLKIAAVFFITSTLWFFWGSDSIGDFAFAYSDLLHPDPVSLVKLAACVASFILLYNIGAFISEALGKTFGEKIIDDVSIAIMLVGFSTLAYTVDGISTGNPLSSVVRPVILNAAEKERADIGYYESLISSGPGNWEVSLKTGRRFDALDKISDRTGDLLVQEFRPGTSGTINGYTIKINPLGLRDLDYTVKKPENTYRIALIGGSYEMGAGISNDEVFEALTEERLNKRSAARKVEIWNYAVGGYTAIQHLEVVKRKVLQSHPDELILFAHNNELKRFAGFFSRYITLGTDLKYEFLKRIKTLSGVRQNMGSAEIRERLNPYMADVTFWAYIEIVNTCKANGIKPVWVFLQTTNDAFSEQDLNAQSALASKAGFRVFVLKDVYKGYPYEKISLDRNNPHPNALGHRLISEKFYNLLSDSTNTLLQ
ncbi:MAG: hypothetical protein ACXVP0_15360 [Bacteroidia bacterium]